MTARLGTLGRVMWCLMLVGACGGSVEADTAATTATGGEGGSTVESSTSSGTTPEATSAPDDDRGDEPEGVADFLGFDLDDPDAIEARLQEDERRAQELIARCMAGEGFDYVPFVSTGMPNRQVRRLAFDEEEFARQQGFGITTWYGSDTEGEQGIESAVDPNEAIVAAMSDSEREAYLDALSGPPQTDDEGNVRRRGGDGGFLFGPGQGEGCRAEAYAEVQGSIRNLLQTVGPQLRELNQRIQADPRMVEATEAWSGCMAEQGYDYNSQTEMFQSVFRDLQQRFRAIVGPAEEEAQVEIDWEALTALQQEERDLAMASFSCGENLQAVLAEIQPEYERQFIDENRDQLEQLRG